MSLSHNRGYGPLVTTGKGRGQITTLDMEGGSSNEISSAEAIFVGAFSSGVNAPTWFVLKITFLLLTLCFTAMLCLAFFSSDLVITGHVLLLVTISTVLFVLLNRFLAETGLVPVEQQIKEMGIHKTEAAEKNKGI
uniref:Uncharacterized protein n=1 Tax=Oryza brachyantha TaxID=4533 RepID=J3MK54_ORYBR